MGEGGVDYFKLILFPQKINYCLLDSVFIIGHDIVVAIVLFSDLELMQLAGRELCESPLMSG